MTLRHSRARSACEHVEVIDNVLIFREDAIVVEVDVIAHIGRAARAACEDVEEVCHVLIFGEDAVVVEVDVTRIAAGPAIRHGDAHILRAAFAEVGFVHDNREADPRARRQRGVDVEVDVARAPLRNRERDVARSHRCRASGYARRTDEDVTNRVVSGLQEELHRELTRRDARCLWRQVALKHEAVAIRQRHAFAEVAAHLALLIEQNKRQIDARAACGAADGQCDELRRVIRERRIKDDGVGRNQRARDVELVHRLTRQVRKREGVRIAWRAVRLRRLADDVLFGDTAAVGALTTNRERAQRGLIPAAVENVVVAVDQISVRGRRQVSRVAAVVDAVQTVQTDVAENDRVR